MTDEKWEYFMTTGKISDYLEFKKTENLTGSEINENSNSQGNCTQKICSK